MIFSRSKADKGAVRFGFEHSLFTFTFFLVFFLAVTEGASAGYGPEVRLIKDGGGSWGSILEMSVELRGSTARFTVRKKDGLPFNTESNIAIRTGNYNGSTVAANIAQSGISSVNLTVRLDRNPAQSYYAYLFNSYGYAWVGPLKLTGYSGPYPEVSPPDRNDEIGYHPIGSTGLKPPRIDSSPATIFVKKQVRIAVTASACRDGVQLQCVAKDDDQQGSNYYESGWIGSGETVQVPFTFDRPGIKTISCKTISSCCSSTWASRTIRVDINRAPSPPHISPDPAEVKVNVPVRISVLSGSDPDGDQIKVKCRTTDARREHFSSDWLNYQQSVDAVLTFEAVGTKTISCITVDRNKARSLSTERTIRVLPDGSTDRSSRSETKINISVETGPDGTNSKVKVQTSKSDDCAPFCNGTNNITYDKPYLPEEVMPADGQPVYEPDLPYIINESLPDGRP